ncbi:MAG TPA: hypothetical protein VFA20_33085 [Myxococcaceae bacterium]|nr:hypothetical protein [Myxococcaceae bacterium]
MSVYSERFSLPFLSQVVIAAAERKRPGLGPWSLEVQAELVKTVAEELAELKRRFFEVYDDQAYWAKVETTILEVVFPRYAAEAKQFTEAEKRHFGAWRGGDLVARITYALGGFALGTFLVKVPWIPIPQTWDALIFAMAIAAPFLPDAQAWFHHRRYARRIKSILKDVEEVEQQMTLYPALAPVDPAAAVSASAEQPPGDAERVRKKDG